MNFIEQIFTELMNFGKWFEHELESFSLVGTKTKTKKTTSKTQSQDPVTNPASSSFDPVSSIKYAEALLQGNINWGKVKTGIGTIATEKQYPSLPEAQSE